ncbi:hypothetical protein A2U01_0098746, partial [Trifolium medium]|nr:hypothetical protein [Trifolium medium]
MSGEGNQDQSAPHHTGSGTSVSNTMPMSSAMSIPVVSMVSSPVKSSPGEPSST